MTAIAIGFAGGYTAGHVMPLIALAEAWRRQFPHDRLECYGSTDGIEAELVAQAGLPFRGLPASAEYGMGLTGRLRAYREAFRGLHAGRRLLRDRGLDLLVCFGGYACAGAGMAAASLGIPLAVFEANAVPGRSNDLLARFASLRFAAMPEVRAYAAWSDADVVGLPVRRLPHAGRPDETPGRPARLLVTGGTFGSSFLNRTAPPLVAALERDGTPLEVIHQAGRGNEAAVTEAYRHHGIAAKVVGFDPSLPEWWRWADAALCSAGAGTLADAIAAGTPALAVPIERVARGHQDANAEAVATRAPQIAWVRECAWVEPREQERLARLLRRPHAAPVDQDAAGRLSRLLRETAARPAMACAS